MTSPLRATRLYRPSRRPGAGVPRGRSPRPEHGVPERERLAGLAAERHRRGRAAAVRTAAVARRSPPARSSSTCRPPATVLGRRGDRAREHARSAARRLPGRTLRPRRRGRSNAPVTCSSSWSAPRSSPPSSARRSGCQRADARAAVRAGRRSRLLWVTWWMGDALGAVLYAPALILLWTDRRPRTRLEQLEGLVVIAGAGRSSRPRCSASAVIPGAARIRSASCASRWRCGRPFASASARPRSPRWRCRSSRSGARSAATDPYAAELPNRGLLLAQTFAGVVAITTAAMAALVGERQRLYDQLERRVSQRTDQLKLTNEELLAEIAARERVQGALAFEREPAARGAGARARRQLGVGCRGRPSALVGRGLSHLRRRAGPLRGHVSELPGDGPPRRSGPPRGSGARRAVHRRLVRGRAPDRPPRRHRAHGRGTRPHGVRCATAGRS